MNRGMNMARGDWLLFLGTDDALCPRFSIAATYCREAHTLYYGDGFMAKTTRRYAGLFSAAKLARWNICPLVIFYPRAVFAQCQFNTRYHVLTDWALNMRGRHDGQFLSQYVSAVITELNDRTEVSALRADDKFHRDCLGLLRANFSIPIFMWHWAVRSADWPQRVVGLLRWFLRFVTCQR